jgi:hypothetical protein
MWSTTEHVPLDHAHGGENLAAGIGVQTSWNAQYRTHTAWHCTLSPCEDSAM